MSNWPESVPVLTAGDICRNHFGCGKKHCLLGWRGIVFGPASNPLGISAREAIDRVLPSKWPTPARFNDDPENSTASIAEVWNEAMRSLGYTEVYEVTE